MSDGLGHLDDRGNAHMIDVGGKNPTRRRAVAEAVVSMSDEARSLLFSGGLTKGDGLAVARVAGIMGAKRTSDLIPLCHPIGLDSVAVIVEQVDDGARIEVSCEIKAMTGASIAALTLYDMIKGVDRGVIIGPVRLLSKSGGRSGDWTL